MSSKGNAEKNSRPTRNRAATREKILAAVGEILAAEGFKGVGVNAVARKAGVDKVLIYRYFGGLSELMEAFAEQGDFWPSPEELAGGDLEGLARKEPAVRMTTLAVNYLRAIRNRPLTREILAWELVEGNELTRAVESLRETSVRRLLEQLKPEPGHGPDVTPMFAILAAAANYLGARSRFDAPFAGCDLTDEAQWGRLESAFRLMIGGVFMGWR